MPRIRTDTTDEYLDLICVIRIQSVLSVVQAARARSP